MIERAIEKASVLIEALPYIQKFRGETVVVKFGGSILDDPKNFVHILKDIAFMEIVGMRPVLVHGGGKAISRSMKAAGISPNFVKGLRVTDAKSIQIVDQVLNGEVNKMLRDILKESCETEAVYGQNVIRVEKHTEIDEETGETLDWGFVGNVVDVNPDPINDLLDRNIVPVVTPLGADAHGQIHNVNADEAAGAIARHLHARKLVFLSDVPGLLRDVNDPDSIMSTLTRSEVLQLIDRGIIAGGMLPKVGGAVKAIDAGIKKTHIIDASMSHSLLLELFTDKGVGTEIIA
jgi:acetylglutamate kinase